jgi:spore coat polysaccharide biosynthesis protein SpsF
MDYRISAIIEARSLSSRLPRKILLKVRNKTILEHLIDNLKSSKKIKNIIIATTNNPEDIAIVKIAKKLKVNYFRGDENNVLKRVIDASIFFNVKTIVRITSDCPLIDIKLVDQFIDIFNYNNFDLVGNTQIRSYPAGMDVEIINAKSLKRSYQFAKSKYLREHICLTMYKKKKIFKICNIVANSNDFAPNLSVTLDEIKDFVLISKIINFFDRRKLPSCSKLINLLYKKKWNKINSSVKRLKHKLYIYKKN